MSPYQYAQMHTYLRARDGTVWGKDNATITQHNSTKRKISGEANGP